MTKARAEAIRDDIRQSGAFDAEVYEIHRYDPEPFYVKYWPRDRAGIYFVLADNNDYRALIGKLFVEALK